MNIKNEELLTAELMKVNELLVEQTEDNAILYTILDQVTDAFYTLDKEWRYTYLNKAAEKSFIVPKEEMLGRNIWEIFPEGYSTKLYEKLNEAANKQIPVQFEEKGIYTGKWFETRAYPSKNGLSVFFRDISNRKKKEEQLQNAEERFNMIFQLSPSVIIISETKSGKILDVNQAFSDCLGYSRDEVIGQYSLFDFGVPEVRKKLIVIFLSEGRIINQEVEVITKLAEVKSVLISANYFYAKGEKYLLATAIDITKDKQLEKELSRLDRLNLIGQMASSIGHEVRNPMTSVKGFLQLLGSQETDEEKIEYYKIMISEIERANSIITEFLSLANNKRVELKPKNLNEIIKGIFPLLKSDAIKHNKEIELELGSLPLIMLDEKEISQLIINLTRNGLEAMESAGVLSIKTTSQDSYITLTIQDQGKGIPKDLIDRLGTPFLTTKDEGTGLGLSICYSIASRHKATISVETSSAGSAFMIKFKKPQAEVY
jgi:PAS domain S-box-containing protein